MHAASGRYTQVVSLLVLYKADVNLCNAAGWTALMFAVSPAPDVKQEASKEEAGSQTLLELLKAGADSNVKTHTGVTPLMLACMSGSSAMVQALVEHAADLNVCDHIGMTPLMLAADRGHVAAVQLLLESFASVDASDVDGRTALLSASSHAYEDIVSVLLQGKADAGMNVSDSGNVLLLALESWHAMDAVLFESKRESARAVARMLLRARACFEDSSDRKTALEFAAQMGETEILAVLQSNPETGVSHVSEGGG
jgi:ankyrin repeat protein